MVISSNRGGQASMFNELGYEDTIYPSMRHIDGLLLLSNNSTSWSNRLYGIQGRTEENKYVHLLQEYSKMDPL
jgi:hypothetical protein